MEEMLENLGVSWEDLWQFRYQKFSERRKQGVPRDWPKLEQAYEKSLHTSLSYVQLRG